MGNEIIGEFALARMNYAWERENRDCARVEKES